MSMGVPRGSAARVLIVPFMELKSAMNGYSGGTASGLNRTFYGIEIGQRGSRRSTRSRLNRTFYGIEIV